jgi:phycobilisome rod-core linker protein
VPIPLLEYSLTTNNTRVDGYDIGGDAQARIFSTDNLLSPSDMDVLIEAAYRQIFFHAFKADRERFLESQLRSGQITVRQFIRGLILSNTFRKSFYDLNSNYRFVEHCVQRVLGRDVHGEKEKIAWSIVVATKGIQGFVDELLNSAEYLDAFGDSIVPYQRRRVLASGTSEVAFNIKTPRYNEYHRGLLGFPQVIWQTVVKSYKSSDRQAKVGDPSLYMDMAMSIAPRGNNPQNLSAQNLDYQNLVPRR